MFKQRLSIKELTRRKEPISVGASVSWAELIDYLAEHSPLSQSEIHGVNHWSSVIGTGLILSSRLGGLNDDLIRLFGLLHDACREDEGDDPDHGRRAGKLVRRLHGRLFNLGGHELGLLEEACAGHSDGTTHDDLTVGAMWDADRLNLIRLGIIPHRRYLSTQSALGEDLSQTVQEFCSSPPTWAECGIVI